MKNILTLTTMFFVSILYGQGIIFNTENLKEISSKAKKENKLIFIDAYTTWCGPCKMMTKQIFPLDSVGEFYNSNFINAKFDMEKGEGLRIAKKYNIKAYPTFLFINGDGKEVYRAAGFLKENDFIKIGKEAIDPTKSITFLKNEFDKGNRDPEILLNLGLTMLHKDPKLSEKVAKIYFEKYPEIEITKNEAILIFSNINSSKSDLLKIIENRKDEIEAVTGKKSLDNHVISLKINEALKSTFNPETGSFSYKKLKSKLLLFLNEEDAEYAINKQKLHEALSNKDYQKYEILALETYKDFSTLDYIKLNEISWNFFLYVENKNSLKKAIEWSKLSVEKNEIYANTDTLANLYNKIGDKTNAKIWAEKSISIAKKSGEDSTDTQKLLNSL